MPVSSFRGVGIALLQAGCAGRFLSCLGLDAPGELEPEEAEDAASQGDDKKRKMKPRFHRDGFVVFVGNDRDGSEEPARQGDHEEGREIAPKVFQGTPFPPLLCGFV